MNNTERDMLIACAWHKKLYPEVTKKDRELYVSPTGNDLCGKGTLALPYLTVERAEQDIAAVIAHKVQIRILGDLATPERWGALKRHTFVGEGSMQIYGVGTPEVLQDGLLVAAANAVGLGYQKITIGAGGPMVPKALRGYWVFVQPGLAAEKAFRVVDNDATTIWIEADPFGGGVANGDVLAAIRPSISVVLDGADIGYDSASDYYDAGTHGQCHEVIANLRMIVSGSTDGRVRLHGTPDQYDSLNFDFATIEGSPGVDVAGCPINQTPCIAQDYVAGCEAGVVNMGSFVPAGLVVVTALERDASIYTTGDVLISGVACTGVVKSMAGSLVFIGSASKLELSSRGGSVMAMLLGVSAHDTAVDIYCGDWDVTENSIGGCLYALGTRGGSTVRLGSTSTCDAALTAASALLWGRGSHVQTNDDCAGFLGAMAGQQAYISEADPAVKSAAWPAAGGYVTDAKGADLLRVA